MRIVNCIIIAIVLKIISQIPSSQVRSRTLYLRMSKLQFKRRSARASNCRVTDVVPSHYLTMTSTTSIFRRAPPRVARNLKLWLPITIHPTSADSDRGYNQNLHLIEINPKLSGSILNSYFSHLRGQYSSDSLRKWRPLRTRPRRPRAPARSLSKVRLILSGVSLRSVHNEHHYPQSFPYQEMLTASPQATKSQSNTKPRPACRMR